MTILTVRSLRVEFSFATEMYANASTAGKMAFSRSRIYKATSQFIVTFFVMFEKVFLLQVLKRPAKFLH